MKRCLIVIPLIAGVMFFSGCLGLNSGLASGGWIRPGGWSSGESGGSGDSGGSSESLGIDPATQAGIDNGTYPSSRYFTVGLNVTFK